MPAIIPQPIREILGDWAGPLGDSELGVALVGAGVLQARPYLVDGGNEPSTLSEGLHAVFAWARENEMTLDWHPPREALTLLTAERCVAALGGEGARIEMALDPRQSVSAHHWQQSLLAGRERLDWPLSAYLALEDSGSSRWRWPLPLAVLAHDDSPFRNQLEAFTSWPELELLASPEACDVLLVPRHVSELELIEVPFGVSPTLIVVLGDIDVEPEQVADFADRWTDRFGASGCHFVDGDNPDSWTREFLRELSHNLPLDVALSLANSRSTDREGFTAIHPRLADDARLGNVVGRFVQELYNAPPREIEITDPVRYTLFDFPDKTSASSREIAEYLHDHADGFQYDAESREATGVAELIRAAGELPPLEAGELGEHRGEDGSEIRVINGALLRNDERLQTALVVNEQYRLKVWIGIPTADSDTAPGAPPLPTEDLPAGKNHLQVTFASLQNRWREQTKELTLEDEGDSEPIYFDVLADEPGQFFGRIIVSHGGRILQTATLRARVFKSEPSRIGRPRIDVETLTKTRLTGLPDARAFDLAMVVNRDDAGDQTASVITKAGVTLRSVDGFEQSKQDLVALLNQVADSPDDYSDITSEACVRLLFELATLGEAMHAVFVDDHGIRPDFFDTGRIQLISASPDSYLPVELFYAGPAPTDEPEPQLCDNFENAALTGTCSTCEAPSTEDLDPTAICPSWFWGIRYVIERHAHDPNFRELAGAYRLQNEPTPSRNEIAMLQAVVMAMSANVRTEDQLRMRAELPKASNATGEATSWLDMKSKVGSLNPSMVLLLPHTEKLGIAFAMEIASDKLLRANKINSDYVSPSGTPAIAVLLGCDTAHTDVPFQGLVPRFRRAGAGVVISTVNTILGRHAVPVATRLLDLARDIPGASSVGMGDLLRDLRRRTLAEGYPMVLSVVGFGDADWRIASAGATE